MGVDLTMGTGWPFGGPHITPAHAATKLVIQKYSLRAGRAFAGLLGPVTITPLKNTAEGQ